MAWKPEHAAARKAKAESDPEYRAKRNAQSAPDKDARKTYMQAYYAANPEKFKATTPEKNAQRNAARRERYAKDQEWRAAHKESVKQWQEQNPAKRKAQRLKQYSLTPAEHAAMLDQQQGVCAICKTAPEGPKMFPMVDYCHTTGKVRGILCSHCNMGIGKFKDSPELLQAAIGYLLNRGSSGVI